MATSSFKSTSKRGTRNTRNDNSKEYPTPTSSSSSSSKPLRRRSLSISAVSRISRQDASSEFSNKRDNPLFWTSNISPSDQDENRKVGNEKEKETSLFDGFSKGKVARDSAMSMSTNREVDNRGRSTTRSSRDIRNGIGRSLSRVRGRPVSRGRYGSANENEMEHDPLLLKTINQRRELRHVAKSSIGSALVEKDTVTHDRVSGSKIAALQSQHNELSEDDSNYSIHNSTGEDGISISSFSEADDKIIQTSEQVMRRDNVNNISTYSAADIPPNLNPEAVDLVLSIRKEYCRKLEESQERTRQLKADLAVEEHHGQELNRILKEIVPDSRKFISPQRTRIARRRSNERKKMSQRLTEEAMAYFDHFDECVSTSTFDGSDFSAPEDPPHSSIGATSSDCKSLVEPHESMEGFSRNTKISCGISKLSFMHESPKHPEVDDDIRRCIKLFERETVTSEINAETVASHCDDASAYKLIGHIESLWFHQVVYNKRIDSGGLLLCGGGIAVAGFPFGSSSI
ncbi:hypothetical protein DM860_011533 [Cuscuta australis]|nr:hypothetical protein DM860_011533 [Cuscuta australis]